MKRFFPLVLAALLIPACSKVEESQRKWPEVQVTNIDGDTVSTIDILDDRPSIVNVWAVWCEPCKKELPALQIFATKHKELNVFTLNMGDDPASVSEYFADHGISLKVLVDSEGTFTSEIGVTSVPTTIFIDAERSVLEIHKGLVSEKFLESAVSRLFD